MFVWHLPSTSKPQSQVYQYFPIAATLLTFVEEMALPYVSAQEEKPCEMLA